MITYRATLDVPAETALSLAVWLGEHRRSLGTRKSRRAASCYRQAVLVLRWFRDDTSLTERPSRAATNTHSVLVRAALPSAV
ncbi:hypothetical protein [Kribbella sp. NBC_00359]|uniref:hypothetical protein n=1 Tax=Kribbella sp. NBC_00359 TaxID=2975966 RepID=UPI003FA5A13B